MKGTPWSTAWQEAYPPSWFSHVKVPDRRGSKKECSKGSAWKVLFRALLTTRLRCLGMSGIPPARHREKMAKKGFEAFLPNFVLSLSTTSLGQATIPSFGHSSFTGRRLEKPFSLGRLDCTLLAGSNSLLQRMAEEVKCLCCPDPFRQRARNHTELH